MFNQEFDSISCNYSSIESCPISVVLSKLDNQWIEGDFIDFSFEKVEIPFELTKPSIFNFESNSNIIYGMIYQAKEMKEKTPTILYIYQGPHVQLVKNDYSMYSNGRLQIIASLGYNVVVIDGRGSFNRGLKFEGVLKHKMGQVELEDQIAGLKHLIEHSNVDEKRIGIHGWSYGGYMSLMGLFQRSDIFKIAISGAPVTEWELYDTGYTERYMGTPKSNPEGYKLGSVLNYSQNVPDDEERLFLIHGGSDENVHFKHSEILILDLIQKGKPFKLGLYPGERHGLRQFPSTVYYYKELIKFISENL
jgi:dipeptidyl aminopeptidase/acylaminoacyl peptidase